MSKSFRFYLLSYISLYILNLLIFVMEITLSAKANISLNLYSPDPECFPLFFITLLIAFLIGLHWGNLSVLKMDSSRKIVCRYLISLNLILIFLSLNYRSEIIRNITLMLFDCFGFDPFAENPEFIQIIVVSGFEMIVDIWLLVQVLVLSLSFCYSIIRPINLGCQQ